MSRGVVQQETKTIDMSNAGKVIGMLGAQLFVIKYADPKGVVQNAFVINAGGEWYTSDDLVKLGGGLAPPSDWLGKSLNQAFRKFRAIDPALLQGSAGEERDVLPTKDAVEVD